MITQHRVAGWGDRRGDRPLRQVKCGNTVQMIESYLCRADEGVTMTCASLGEGGRKGYPHGGTRDFRFIEDAL